MRKMGSVIGDSTEIGCNSVLYPGTIIGKNTNIYPLTRVRGIINSNDSSYEIKENDLIESINKQNDNEFKLYLKSTSIFFIRLAITVLFSSK